LREKHLLLFETPKQELFSLSQSGLYFYTDSSFVHLGSVEILPQKQSSLTKAHYNALTNELIIGSTLGAHTIDMNSVQQHTRVPTLVLNDAIADSTKLHVDAPNKIPYSPKFVHISVSGLSFYDEKESVFRFNLTRNGSPSWSPIQKNAEVQYSQLSFGNYTVTGKMRQADGIWSEETTLVSFEILPPWYFSSYFIGFMTVFSLGIVTFSVRYVTRRKYEKLLIELEKRELLNRERSRIAQDLHDEIGANLTQIALLSELVQKQLSQQNNDASPLKKVVEAAKSGVSNLSEIVWSLNPKHDSLENTVAYIQEFSENFFKHHQIRILFDIQTNLPNVSLSSDIRHSLLMCIKELLNNAMKYSEAETIWIHVSTTDSSLIVIIQDNGKGFVLEDKLHTGNGLGNLFSRMSRHGGDCSIETAPGRGCQVRIQLPI
jgi:two-component sensor histidine kinase